ncbi:MAG: YigZ family protein [Clostridiales bacterium]|nr:YigZ family protein [Clostridiales bacterium]
MEEYYIPTGRGETEFTEKRSRFLGHLVHVTDEEQARAFVQQMKKQYHDARHNCWCYVIREGGIVRYSDDGEPQGTAGQPMLGVLQKEGVTDAVCVVTRYFGGVLLGAGGLLRAYTRSARDALDAAGISAVRRWVEFSIPCGYRWLSRVQLEVESRQGVVLDTEYGAEVTVKALLPEEQAGAFPAQLRDLTAGSVQARITGEAMKAVPVGRAGKR